MSRWGVRVLDPDRRLLHDFAQLMIKAEKLSY